MRKTFTHTFVHVSAAQLGPQRGAGGAPRCAAMMPRLFLRDAAA